MKRLSVSLEDSSFARLKERARLSGRTFSAEIRDAVDLILEEESRLQADDAVVKNVER